MQGLNYNTETKKQHIQKTLSEINIASQKGPKIFQGGCITLEGTSTLPRIGAGSKTQYAEFNRTSNTKLPSTLLFQNQTTNSLTRPTESVSLKEIPRLSYKIIKKPKKTVVTEEGQ